MSSGLPAWTREIQTLLPVCPQYVLTGNIKDYYFGPADGDGNAPLMELPDLIAEALMARGVRVVLAYEPSEGTRLVAARGITTDELEELVGGSPEQVAEPERLAHLRDLIGRLAEAAEPVGLIVESASRLVLNGAALTDQEFSFFRRVDRICRTATPAETVDGRVAHSPIIWVADDERDLPVWFTLRNTMLRSVSIPLPDGGERRRLAERLLPRLAKDAGHDGPLDRSVQVLAEQTVGMGLSAIQSTLAIARDQRLGPDHVEDAARAFRVGVAENPWRAEFIAHRLRDETSGAPPMAGGRGRLGDRVLGQERAVEKALDILTRSAAGLTAAQAGPSATRPRGVLFFAGPTGVGKTELAKAITQLLFDDERFYIRFDMSEFSAEHAADRLIGSPPGYVGHEAGGELTNAIKERPFSVVLFDEIEKADARILDKFLQVLDDGRLTDGRGETVFFTESVIIFTSNLGIYKETRDPSGAMRRELAISRETHPTPAERAEAIKSAIRDHFTLRLGRPELLNRIGTDNIVVFDFIDAERAAHIFDRMLGFVSARLEREHGQPLRLARASLDELRAVCLDDDVLAMGGRGIGAKLETALINPLARLMVLEPRSEGLIVLARDGERWTARWS